MADPILRIRFAVQRCIYDVDVSVGWVEVLHPDCCRLLGFRVSDIDRFKEWARDEIDILASDWKQAHLREDRERSHGAGVVVARKTGFATVEG